MRNTATLAVWLVATLLLPCDCASPHRQAASKPVSPMDWYIGAGGEGGGEGGSM